MNNINNINDKKKISKGYRNYLRCEIINKIIDREYKVDYSYSSI